MFLVVGLTLSLDPTEAAMPSGATPIPRATVTQDQQKEIALTVYNGNLGLVRDVGEATLPPGIQERRFMGGAAQIDPPSVYLKSLTDTAGLRILEQNYEYD